MAELVLIECGGLRYAFRRTDVRGEIKDVPLVHSLPGAPMILSGIAPVEGRTLLLYDLSAALGHDAYTRRETGRAVLLTAGEHPAGLVFQRELGRVQAKQDDIIDLPASLRTSEIAQFVLFEGEAVPVVEIVALFDRVSQGRATPLAGMFEAGQTPEFEPPNAGRSFIVSVGGERFALSASLVQGSPRKFDLSCCRSMPHAPGQVLGIISSEDQVIGVLDPGPALGITEVRTRGIVLVIEGTDLGLAVDELLTETDVSGEAVRPVPSIIKGLCSHVLVHNGEIVTYLDPGALLSAAGAELNAADAYEISPFVLPGGQDIAVREFLVGGAVHALPEEHVEDIVDAVPVYHAPGAGRSIAVGMALYGNEVLPVLDISLCFGLRTQAEGAARMALFQQDGLRALVLAGSWKEARVLNPGEYGPLPINLPRPYVVSCYAEDVVVRLVLNLAELALYFVPEEGIGFLEQEGGEPSALEGKAVIAAAKAAEEEAAIAAAKAAEEEAATAAAKAAEEEAAIAAAKAAEEEAATAAAKAAEEGVAAAAAKAAEEEAAAAAAKAAEEEATAAAAKAAEEEATAAAAKAAEEEATAAAAKAAEEEAAAAAKAAEEEATAAAAKAAEEEATAAAAKAAEEEATAAAAKAAEEEAAAAAKAAEEEAAAAAAKAAEEEAAVAAAKAAEEEAAAAAAKAAEEEAAAAAAKAAEEEAAAAAAKAAEEEAAAAAAKAAEEEAAAAAAKAAEEEAAAVAAKAAEEEATAAKAAEEEAAAAAAKAAEEGAAAVAAKAAEEEAAAVAAKAAEEEAAAPVAPAEGYGYMRAEEHQKRKPPYLPAALTLIALLVIIFVLSLFSKRESPHVGKKVVDEKPAVTREAGRIPPSREMEEPGVPVKPVIPAEPLPGKEVPDAGISAEVAPEPERQEREEPGVPVKPVIPAEPLPEKEVPEEQEPAERVEPPAPAVSASVQEKTEKKEKVVVVEIEEKKGRISVMRVLKAPEGSVSYVVQKGDTLWDIAERFTGDPFRYPAIANVNEIQNPDLIFPDQLIYISVIKEE